MTVEFIREIEGEMQPGQTQCLVRKDGVYYVVSSVPRAFDTGLPETLVFMSDADGQIESYRDYAGGSNVSREQAIEELDTGIRSKRPGLPGLLESILGPIYDDETFKDDEYSRLYDWDDEEEDYEYS